MHSSRCIPPARNRMGVSLTETPLDRDPALDRDPFLDQDPPWTETPRTETPRGQTDTCENITFANFYCGR